MNEPTARPTLEEVLEELAVESDFSRAILERYLSLYPEYSDEILDLARELELGRQSNVDTGSLSSADQSLIDSAWSRHVGTPATIDPVPSLTIDDWRAVALKLEVPRQVVTALKERRVSLASIPRKFLARFAAAINRTVVELEAWWDQPQLGSARSYKADQKPDSRGQVTFERVLIDAGVPAEKRAHLLEPD